MSTSPFFLFAFNPGYHSLNYWLWNFSDDTSEKTSPLLPYLLSNQTIPPLRNTPPPHLPVFCYCTIVLGRTKCLITPLCVCQLSARTDCDVRWLKFQKQIRTLEISSHPLTTSHSAAAEFLDLLLFILYNFVLAHFHISRFQRARIQRLLYCKFTGRVV